MGAVTVAPERHLVHKAVNRQMTLLSVDVKQCAFIGLLFIMMWLAFHMFFGSLVVCVPFLLFSRWAARRDPHMMQFLLESKNRRARYDPAKHDPVEVVVR